MSRFAIPLHRVSTESTIELQSHSMSNKYTASLHLQEIAPESSASFIRENNGGILAESASCVQYKCALIATITA